MTTLEHGQVDETVDDERQEARKRVQARRDFGSHLVAYFVINRVLVLVWAVTGAGYFSADLDHRRMGCRAGATRVGRVPAQARD